MSHLEDNLAAFLRGQGCPEPQREYKFDASRRWRIDLAWPEVKLAVEVDGGTRGQAVVCHACGTKVRAKLSNGKPGKELRIGGGHNRGDAHQAQYEKQNAMAVAGWLVLRYSSQQLSEKTVQVIEQIIETHAGLVEVQP